MGDRSIQDLGRLGAALLVAAALGFLLVVTSSGSDDGPEQTAVPGPVGGEVVTVAGPPATPTSSGAHVSPAQTAPPAPTATPAATPQPTPAPTPAPDPTPAPPADGFSAQVFACRSVSGPNCQGQVSEMAASGSFSVLILLENSRPGDVIEATLVGGGRTARGGPVTVQGGDGYYFTTFGVNGLPPGTYTIAALRNGQQVATTAIILR